MGHKLLESIIRDEKPDVMKGFRSLVSVTARAEFVSGWIDVCRQPHDHLVNHRYLTVLAWSIEELAKTPSPTSQMTMSELVRPIQESGLLVETSPEIPITSTEKLARYIAGKVRAQASNHLRAAILEVGADLTGGFSTLNRTSDSFGTAAVQILAPARLDLGMGGIADIPPYSLEGYGNCLNMPVRLDRRYPVEVKVESLPETLIHLVSRDMAADQLCHDHAELADGPPSLKLHREVIRFFMDHVLHLSTSQDLYALLNGGLRLETNSSLPVGTGLGVSSVLLCALIKALGILFGVTFSPEQLFVASVYLENLTGIGGGWEDATVVYRGLKLMESFPETPLSPQPKTLAMEKPVYSGLKENLVLLHTGIPKAEGGFFEEMVERYCLHETITLQAIERNNQLNRQISEAVIAGDLIAVGKGMASQWRNWKTITQGKCTNEQIDELFRQVDPHVYGARMNGAGQGGCAMFMTSSEKKQSLLNVIHNESGQMATVYQWDPVL